MGSPIQRNQWIFYLIILTVIAIFLLLFEDAPFPVPGNKFLARWIEIERAKESESDISPVFSDMADKIGLSKKWFSTWADDDTWRAGVTSYLEMAAESQRTDWIGPPAAHQITTELNDLQENILAERSVKTYQGLHVKLSNGIQPNKRVHYYLNIGIQGRNFKFDVPTENAVIEPLISGHGEFSIYVSEQRKGFVFWVRRNPYQM